MEGEARRGEALLVKATQARPGEAWCGRQGRHGMPGHGEAWQAWQDEVRRVKA